MQCEVQWVARVHHYFVVVSLKKGLEKGCLHFLQTSKNRLILLYKDKFLVLKDCNVVCYALSSIGQVQIVHQGNKSIMMVFPLLGNNDSSRRNPRAPFYQIRHQSKVTLY